MRQRRARIAVRKACAIPLAAFLLFASGGCVATTYGHRTLEGQRFAVERVPELRNGLTTSDVSALLGQPLTTREDGDVSVWHYFERAQPKWCDGGNARGARPEYRIDATLSFRAGILERIAIDRKGF